VEKITQLKRQAVELIDRYFSGTASAEDLHTWALTRSIFANPKELDNSEDWAISNALSLMTALTDGTRSKEDVEKGLREAQRFLTGEESFPEDRWPVGLGGQKSSGSCLKSVR
jgi:hypothetical protein